ncbi:TIGR01777 family oxidoreductase [Microbacterium sp. zg.Y1090]|uniref:TIGR01777 family oxidoreductase n=1 Tax=Microbacterium TaxID=33882 RepID=UPI00214AF23C|nr:MULTISPECIES: TIGR01777 family oxidoreductase [unclassified Microbacterium]MCR2813398.1 TIGR01777 family oxidoreductase [Microbacterium sp. zg.Y1084]MCR2818266.1 TIGR01777 family oxidoreductase [Microbacterium sp. zg.Y1090]MDL5486787.1 TIGR01777 family oxidoreductase [Microbacterium sp. zg-Y1211]WIM27589.1 TIGR01777 family oxidoreductase [Microbacterium sp. zg-Y1090]
MTDQQAPRRVVVAGASGLIGRALARSLRDDGVSVTRLVRRRPEAPDEVAWLTDGAPLDPQVLAGADAVVGLNGASIGRFPWTAAYRNELLWSRILPTQALARAVRELGDEAPAFLSASGVGYYGSAPGERLTEQGRRGETFLADLCGEWEAAAFAASGRARVATLRTAPVVHRDGVLKPLMLLTRAGVSGPIGRGTQAWPWISLDDEVRAIRHVIDADVEGPVNLTGPTRATANDLGFSLAVQLNRPFLVRAPVWALRAALGRDATEGLLTADAHVVPQALEATGFDFHHRSVDDAVTAALRDE